MMSFAHEPYLNAKMMSIILYSSDLKGRGKIGSENERFEARYQDNTGLKAHFTLSMPAIPNIYLFTHPFPTPLRRDEYSHAVSIPRNPADN
jgi:hypothetical protein